MAGPYVVQLENRPGEVAHLSRALAARGIAMRCVSTASAGRFVCATVTTEHDACTRDVLRSFGVPFVAPGALELEIADRPGAVAEVSGRLSRSGVEVQGILVEACHGGTCLVAVSVDDEARARQVLGLPPKRVLVPVG